jgi:hypothetical protein
MHLEPRQISLLNIVLISGHARLRVNLISIGSVAVCLLPFLQNTSRLAPLVAIQAFKPRLVILSISPSQIIIVVL